MKRIIILTVLVLSLSILLTACGGNDSSVDTWAELEDREVL